MTSDANVDMLSAAQTPRQSPRCIDGKYNCLARQKLTEKFMMPRAQLYIPLSYLYTDSQWHLSLGI